MLMFVPFYALILDLFPAPDAQFHTLLGGGESIGVGPTRGTGNSNTADWGDIVQWNQKHPKALMENNWAMHCTDILQIDY